MELVDKVSARGLINHKRDRTMCARGWIGRVPCVQGGGWHPHAQGELPRDVSRALLCPQDSAHQPYRLLHLKGALLSWYTIFSQELMSLLGMLKVTFLSRRKWGPLHSTRHNFVPKCVIGQIKHCPVLSIYFIFSFMYFISTYLIIQLWLTIGIF